MVPIPIPVRKSATRTYILVVYDVLTPNEVRFVKFVLPDNYPNNARWARHYGASFIEDFGTRILDCLPYEEYSEVDQIDNEVKEVNNTNQTKCEGVKFSFYPMEGGLPQDMKEVRHILDAWNDEQLQHETSYTTMLRSILKDLERKNSILSSIDKMINDS